MCVLVKMSFLEFNTAESHRKRSAPADKRSVVFSLIYFCQIWFFQLKTFSLNWLPCESIFSYQFQLTVLKRWQECKWSPLQDQEGGWNLHHSFQSCWYHSIPINVSPQHLLPPSFPHWSSNSSADSWEHQRFPHHFFFFILSTLPTAECYRFCIIPSPFSGSTAGCAAS